MILNSETLETLETIKRDNASVQEESSEFNIAKIIEAEPLIKLNEEPEDE